MIRIIHNYTTYDSETTNHTVLCLLQWVTLSFGNTKVLRQTLNPTAELWCNTLSWIVVLVLYHTEALAVYLHLTISKHYADLMLSIMGSV